MQKSQKCKYCINFLIFATHSKLFVTRRLTNAGNGSVMMTRTSASMSAASSRSNNVLPILCTNFMRSVISRECAVFTYSTTALFTWKLEFGNGWMDGPVFSRPKFLFLIKKNPLHLIDNYFS